MLRKIILELLSDTNLIRIFSVSVTTEIELQIRWIFEDKTKDHFCSHQVHNDPSLEQSWLDGANEGSQCMALWKDKENYP